MQLGYGFHWDPWSKKPYFTRPVDQGGGKRQLVSIGDVPYLADSISKNELKGSPLPACLAPVATRTQTTKVQRASSCPASAGQKHLLDEDAEDIVVVDDANGEKVATLREQPEGEVPPPPKAPGEFQRPPKEGRIQAFLIKEAKSLDHMMDHSKLR